MSLSNIRTDTAEEQATSHPKCVDIAANQGAVTACILLLSVQPNV
jgi:hypothetical protein